MNPLNVAKFGGTSLADHDAMSKSAAVIQSNDETRLVVISACAGVTNRLVQLAHGIENIRHRNQLIDEIRQIHDAILAQLPPNPSVYAALEELGDQIATLACAAVTQPSPQITDSLVASGELMSTHVFTYLLNQRGLKAERFDIRQVLKTNDTFGQAIPDLIETAHHALTELRPRCADHIVVTQGFIGSDNQGNTTTLGRGGSDYSAALLAEAIEADSLEIWTDVPGIYTTDPRLVPNARPIDEISFSEASEMANFGAKILHPSTLLPAIRQDIPVFVGSAKAPEKGGTWIRQQVKQSPLFRALALRCDQTMVTLTSLDMFQSYGFLANVFSILAKHKISVDLISTSEVSIAMTLDNPNTLGGSPQLSDEVIQALTPYCHVSIEQNLCLVALIGNQMAHSRGTGAKIFGALKNYNLRMICYGASDHNLCFLTPSTEAQNVVRTLHQELFENTDHADISSS